MIELFGQVIPEDEQEEFKETYFAILRLSKEERAIVLANATTLIARREIEKARKQE